MNGLLKEYRKKKREIRKRLQCFRGIYKKGNKQIFSELCFCILTPQAKAVVCDRAIRGLQKRSLLFKGSQRDIISCLKGVRFPNNKARYIVEARGLFKNGKAIGIKDRLNTKDLFDTRDWLVKHIKGLGYKEASHFLRNIGLGKDLAILDRHILKNLKDYGIIEEIPDSLSRRNYIEIEEKMKRFFKRVNIAIEEIDLLFWSRETGFIFK
ncbi:N-glycosylase/DNA lyase [Candidatus Omnitrophota bacterium]